MVRAEQQPVDQVRDEARRGPRALSTHMTIQETLSLDEMKHKWRDGPAVVDQHLLRRVRDAEVEQAVALVARQLPEGAPGLADLATGGGIIQTVFAYFNGDSPYNIGMLSGV